MSLSRLLRRLGRLRWAHVRQLRWPMLVYLVSGVLYPMVAYHLRYRASRAVAIAWLAAAAMALGAIFLVVAAAALGPGAGLAATVAVAVALVAARAVATRRTLARLERQARALSDYPVAIADDRAFARWDAMADGVRNAVDTGDGDTTGAEVVLGRVDGQGRVQWGTDARSAGAAGAAIVRVGDAVLRRHEFDGDRAGFVRAWHAAAALDGSAPVPRLHHADLRGRRLYVDYVPAGTLSDLLTAAPAADRERAMGTLLGALERVHERGLTGVALEPERVLASSAGERVWFTEFSQARCFADTAGVTFAHARDRDRERFNALYDQDALTERSARAAVAAMREKHPFWYSPVDFGMGLTIGLFWLRSHGLGRWEYLGKRVVAPLINGKRVLDLGANIGVQPLMMLRSGAEEVVGVELRPENIEIGELVHRIYEWRDQRRYRLSFVEGNMLDILEQDLGTFDVVTAFCSLYYLDGDGMARVVRKVADDIAPVMVLEANEHSTGPEGRGGRARLLYLKHVLERNGFPHVEVHWPDGFHRPFAVGRVAE